MKVVQLSHDGEKGALVLQDEPVPRPQGNDVLIKVHAAALNFRDQAILNHPYGQALSKSIIPLSDGAGEVVATGEKVTRVKIGDRVVASCFAHWIGGPFIAEYQNSSIGFSIDGMLAEQMQIHENALVHLPEYLSYVEGAALPCAAGAAWSSLNLATPLQPGQTVLVQGTGGVALFALQLARLFGARVLAITSSDEKAAKLKELGAESVINYTTNPDWEKDILALTDGVGVDKVIDVAGEKTIRKSAACARIRGEIALVGSVSGYGGGLPPVDILYRSLLVGSSVMGPRTNLEAIIKAMATTKSRSVIDTVYPFAEYLEAYKRIQSGKHVGKVVIDLTK